MSVSILGSETLQVAILIAVMVVGGLIAYLSRRAHRRKVEQYSAWAHQHGWRYTERDSSVFRGLQGTPFGRGHTRHALHVFSGQRRGRQLSMFEYVYKVTSGSGKNRRTRTYRTEVVVVGTPASRPSLEVSREHFGHRMLAIVGVHDLQLESEQFNDAFRIATDNDRFAYDVLHPRTMEWMLADQRAMSMPFRFEGAALLSWDNGRIDLQRALARADYLVDLLERVPTFVWQNR